MSAIKSKSIILAKAVSWVASQRRLTPPSRTECFIAGYEARDAEVALLKAKIQLLEEHNQDLKTYIHAHA
jgi:hypothetical protein